MNIKYFFLLSTLLLLFLTQLLSAQQNTFDISIQISVAQNIKTNFEEKGRLFVFLNQNPKAEPRLQIWPSPGNYIFAKNIVSFDPNEELVVDHSDAWTKTPDWDLQSIPSGDYYLQVLWDQDTEESRINAEGNFFSKKIKINGQSTFPIKISLSEQIESMKLVVNEHVKLVDIESDTLSKWWGKPMHVKASVLLPHGYQEDANRSYPIRYNVAGYGGRYDRVNRLVSSSSFMEWWISGDAPQVITVYLDGEGPFGDSYQMDSENSGPYGYSFDS